MLNTNRRKNSTITTKFRPRVEALEDRQAMSTFSTTSTLATTTPPTATQTSTPPGRPVVIAIIAILIG